MQSEAIAIGFGLRDGRNVTPITRIIPEAELLSAAGNTISFEKDAELKKRLIDLLSLSCTGG